MLQFLRLNRNQTEKSEYALMEGSQLYRFLARRLGYILLLAYSTLFLAVAIPFLWTYFIGGMLIMIFLVRFISQILMLRKYRGGKIAVGSEGLEVTNRLNTFTIPAENITYLEINVLGNLLIREKYVVTSFPIDLLKEEDRTSLIQMFEDMAPKRTQAYKKTWELFDAILVAFILAMHIRQFIVQAYYIPTGSMENTLQVGDHLLVEKITYGPVIPQMIFMKKEVRLWGLRKVQKGDIIIFKPPGEEERDFIKRCIAVEGDNFHINDADGFVYINGKKMDEPFVKDYAKITDVGITDYKGFGNKRLIEGVVPKGMVIAMGDNRTNSQDSRYFGYVPVERIKGRAFVLYWNTDQVIGRKGSIKEFFFTRIGLIR